MKTKTKKEKKTKKICLIINSRFSYLLQVDGHEIAFTGLGNVEYFEEHYKSLGYEVYEIDDSD